jgi:hypothetical protein
MGGLNQKGQIVDRLVVVDQQHLLGNYLEAAIAGAQAMDRAAGEDILLAASQFDQHEVRSGDDLTLASFFDHDIGKKPAHAGPRFLGVGEATVEPRDAKLEADPVVVDQRDLGEDVLPFRYSIRNLLSIGV